jgi:pimeloyl-ACP methyl ester carboxylesterase
LAAVLSLAVAALAAGSAAAQNSKKVPIPTFDGVELQGTFWAARGNNRDACVILLHHIDYRKGGNSHSDGWDDLAEALQKDGYSVLSFDFRGFGESKTVSKSFWMHPHNINLPGARRLPQPETIDHKTFPANYFPVLVNDIAAARAYLDRQNDLKIVNSSNLIIIGAGEGATLGALWMAAEFHRARAPGATAFGAGILDDPEGRDLAGAIWLSMSPRLAGRSIPALDDAVKEVAKKNKVPMLFVYGQQDKASEQLAFAMLKGIVPDFKLGQKPKSPEWQYTRDFAVKKTSLAGSQLLNKNLETIDVIRSGLKDIMEKRGAREPRDREMVKSAYFWVFGRQQMLAKRPGEEMPQAVPLSSLGIR